MELVIPNWANGPDDSANGGYASGLLAQQIPDSDDGVFVNLRMPPPLETPLTVAVDPDAGKATLKNAASELIADAQRETVELAIPISVRMLRPDKAEEGRSGYAYATNHPFPRCLTCGISRPKNQPEHQIHCGPVNDVFAHDAEQNEVAVYADSWTPSKDFAAEVDSTQATIEACWSALDCPSAAPFADPERPAVLARFGVRMMRPVLIGEPHVLAAWELARDGRKLSSASVLLNAQGEVLGFARALWIELRKS